MPQIALASGDIVTFDHAAEPHRFRLHVPAEDANLTTAELYLLADILYVSANIARKLDTEEPN